MCKNANNKYPLKSIYNINNQMITKKNTESESHSPTLSLCESTKKTDKPTYYHPYFKYHKIIKTNSIDLIDSPKLKVTNSPPLPSFKHELTNFKSMHILALNKLEAFKNSLKSGKSFKYIEKLHIKPTSSSPLQKYKIRSLSPQPLLSYTESSRPILKLKPIESPKKLETPSGFIQENLDNPLNSPKSHNFHIKTEKILGQTFINPIKKCDSESLSPKKLESSYVTHKEITIIISEYQKPEPQRDYFLLDSILIKNTFFSRFSPDVRMKLMKISSPHIFKSGKSIMTDQSKSQDMFAIIRGAIVIEKISEECGNTIIQVASLYDGRSFGELSLVPNNSPNPNTFNPIKCKATESTLVFALPKIEYNNILLSQLENSLDKKIQVLTETTIFKNINFLSLIPFATNIDIVNYENNEFIIQKGQKPQGVYIIAKGFAMAVTEGFRIKPKPKRKDPSIHGKSLKSLIVNPSKPGFNSEKNYVKGLEKKINKEVLRGDARNWEEFLTILTEEEQKLINDECLLVKERIVYSILKEKDYFGCRSVVIMFEGKGKDLEPAKFTIVAQSERVEIMILKPYFFTYLSEDVLQEVLGVLKNSYEIDSPDGVDAESVERMFAEWVKYKETIFHDIQHNAINEKKKKFFPFLKF